MRVNTEKYLRRDIICYTGKYRMFFEHDRMPQKNIDFA